MRLTSFQTKLGQTIDLGRFNVLVGPNNVGKTQTLRDLHQCMVRMEDPAVKIVSGIRTAKSCDFNTFRGFHIDGPNPGHGGDARKLSGLAPNLNEVTDFSYHEADFKARYEASDDHTAFVQALGKFCVTYASPYDRQQLALDTDIHNRYSGPPAKILQRLFENDNNSEQLLVDAFKDVFGADIRLDCGAASRLRLVVGKNLSVPTRDARLSETRFGKETAITVEGDGYRTVAGTILSLIFSHARVVLMDEPEAFLHPIQQRKLAAWISTHLERFPGQLLVSTHSAHFLAGLLHSGAPVDLFRVSRADVGTSFVRVPREKMTQLANDPLLSSQRALEGYFHTGVVVCEGGQDRTVYQTVCERNTSYRDFLFLESNGKQNSHGPVGQLVQASVPVATIVDADILNDWNILKKLIFAFDPSVDLVPIKAAHEQIRRAIGIDEDEVKKEIRQQLSEIEEEIDVKTVRELRIQIGKLEKSLSMWRDLKNRGTEGVPGHVRPALEALFQLLKSHRIFVVPVGTLEGWSVPEPQPQDFSDRLKRLRESPPANLVTFLTELGAVLQSS